RRGVTRGRVGENNRGGRGVGKECTWTAAGPTPLSGSTPVDSGAGFSAGTYTLSESGPSGYAASSWSCVGGTQASNQITVGLGESATCTITNNDNPPALHLRKVVVNNNGGTAAAKDWKIGRAARRGRSGSTRVGGGATTPEG